MLDFGYRLSNPSENTRDRELIPYWRRVCEVDAARVMC